MKRILTLSLACLAMGQGAFAAAEEKDWTDSVKEALVVYENKDTFLKKLRLTLHWQYQVAVVQPNGSNGDKLRPAAGPVNQEFRRFLSGYHAEMDYGLSSVFLLRIGGVPIRETYPMGRTKKNYNYTGIFMLNLRKNFADVPGLYLMGGKLMPHFCANASNLSNSIKTLERPIFCRMSWGQPNWGMEIGYRPKRHNYAIFQLLTNDRALNVRNSNHPDGYGKGDGFNGEFGWEDKCYAVLATSYRFAEGEKYYQQAAFQYAHDFNNIYQGNRRPGANNYGLNMQDAASVSHEIGSGKWRLLNKALVSWNQIGAEGNHSVGYQFEPVYTITPQVDVVFRYTAMVGDGACNLDNDRYICRQTSSAAWVDSLQAFYVGGSYYFSAKNPDAAKLMLGAEYTTARKNGQNAYSGWTFSSAIRFDF